MEGLPESLEAQVLSCAREFIRAYTQVISEHYSSVRDAVSEIGYRRLLLPLYDRRVGADVAIAALLAEYEFFLFFVDRQNVSFVQPPINVSAVPAFNRDWTFQVPSLQRILTVVQHLGINDATIVPLGRR